MRTGSRFNLNAIFGFQEKRNNAPPCHSMQLIADGEDGREFPFSGQSLFLQLPCHGQKFENQPDLNNCTLPSRQLFSDKQNRCVGSKSALAIGGVSGPAALSSSST